MYQNYYPVYQPQYQQNYQQTYQQVPNYQQNTQMLNGRAVNSIEEISANDVPMNAPFSVFPKSDMSEIYVKSWNGNGTISTKKYVCESENVEKNTSNLEEVKEYIDARFDKLEKILKPTRKKENEEA